MRPAKPDPLFGFAQQNYLIVGWLASIVGAGYGDINGDGAPDVAIATRRDGGTRVKVFLNHQGRFSSEPDLIEDTPELGTDYGAKVRLIQANSDRIADLFVAGDRQAVLLASKNGALDYRIDGIPDLRRGGEVAAGDFSRDGQIDLLLGQRFVHGLSMAFRRLDGTLRLARNEMKLTQYVNVHLVDVDFDGRPDLITSGGEVFLRRADGTLPQSPSQRLSVPGGKGWTLSAVGDFNKDSTPDVVFLTQQDMAAEKGRGKPALQLHVFYNSGDGGRLFANQPQTIETGQPAFNKDGPTVADWNSDGVADLAVPMEDGAVIVPGSPRGLDGANVISLKLDYQPHGETRLGVADFDGDGRPDLAGWGPSRVGAHAVYIWLQP
jgi:hypothetical protein